MENETPIITSDEEQQHAVAARGPKRYDPIMVITLVETHILSDRPLIRHWKTEVWARQRPNDIATECNDNVIRVVAETDKLVLCAEAFPLSTKTLNERFRHRIPQLTKEGPAMLQWLWNFYAHFAPNRVLRTEKRTTVESKKKGAEYNEITLIITNEREMLLLLAAVCTFVAFNGNNLDRQVVSQELHTDAAASPLDKAVSCVKDDPLPRSVDAIVRCTNGKVARSNDDAATDESEIIKDVSTFFNFFLRFKVIQSWRVLYSRHTLPRPCQTAIDTERLRGTDSYVPKVVKGKSTEKDRWMSMSDEINDAWVFKPCGTGSSDDKKATARRYAKWLNSLPPMAHVMNAVMNFSSNAMQHDRHAYKFWYTNRASTADEQQVVPSSPNNSNDNSHEEDLALSGDCSDFQMEETPAVHHRDDDSMACYDASVPSAGQHLSSTTDSSSSMHVDDAGVLSAVDDSAAGVLHHLRHPSPSSSSASSSSRTMTAPGEVTVAGGERQCPPRASAYLPPPVYDRLQTSSMDVDAPTSDVHDFNLIDEGEVDFCFGPPPSLTSCSSGATRTRIAQRQRLIIGRFGR